MTYKIAADLIKVLRDAVYAQDAGIAVGEQVTYLIGHSASHALMVAIDNERRRMAHEGLNVITEQGDARVARLIAQESSKSAL